MNTYNMEVRQRLASHCFSAMNRLREIADGLRKPEEYELTLSEMLDQIMYVHEHCDLVKDGIVQLKGAGQ